MNLKGGYTGKITDFFLNLFFQLWSPPQNHKFLSPQKNQFFSELEKQLSFFGDSKNCDFWGGAPVKKKSPCIRF